MTLAGLVVAGAVVLLLHLRVGPLPPVAAFLIAAGVVGTMALGGALMTLLFLSHGTGHDDRVADPFKDQ